LRLGGWCSPRPNGGWNTGVGGNTGSWRVQGKELRIVIAWLNGEGKRRFVCGNGVGSKISKVNFIIVKK